MAYPYSTLPTPVSDATTATPNTHSGHHQSVHTALNDLLTELGTDPGGGTSVTSRLSTLETKVLPAGGTSSQVLTKTSGTDYAVGWTTAAAASLTALHSALLAVKVWSSTQYVWSGDGTAPDASSYTQILFIDPAGTHDPTTSTGGRTNANDLWETGTPLPPAGTYVTAQGGGLETVSTQATASGSVTLDLNSGNVHVLTLTGNVTSLTVSNTTAGKSCTFTLVVKQDGTGSRTWTWMTGAKWAAGTAPTISSAANKVDVFTFMTVDNGSTWYGFTAGQDVR